MKKQHAHIVPVLALLFLVSFQSLQGQTLRRSPQAKRFRVILSYGNLMGLGAGAEVRLFSVVSATLLGGYSMKVPYPLLAPPYAGNRYNVSFRLTAAHWSGFYASAGAYLGSFDLISEDPQFQEKVIRNVVAPVLTVGFKATELERMFDFAFELGIAYGLPESLWSPETYEVALASYRIRAPRSHRSMGDFFPFFTFLFFLS